MTDAVTEICLRMKENVAATFNRVHIREGNVMAASLDAVKLENHSILS